MCVIVVSSNTLCRPYRTAEDRSGEVLDLTHDAAVVTLSVESEGKQTGGLYAVSSICPTLVICPAQLGSNLSDVAMPSETVRVRVCRWSVVQLSIY